LAGDNEREIHLYIGKAGVMPNWSKLIERVKISDSEDSVDKMEAHVLIRR